MKRTLKSLFCAALVAAIALPAAPSMAASAGEAIKERRALMKNNGRNFRTVANFVKKGEGSAADVKASAEKLAANAAKLSELFPKGSSMADGVGKTRAKPEIWRNRADFEAEITQFGRLAAQLSAAAATGDKTKIAAAFGELGKQSCSDCHRKYRGPKQ